MYINALCVLLVLRQKRNRFERNAITSTQASITDSHLYFDIKEILTLLNTCYSYLAADIPWVKPVPPHIL